jgi:phage/conjugal plasmid C-4 type zinc finger TraR family protein
LSNQADNLDVAAEYQQERTDARVAAQVAAHRNACARISRDDCLQCGIDIPVARQIAVPGVQCCRDCQALIDLRANGVRRV